MLSSALKYTAVLFCAFHLLAAASAAQDLPSDAPNVLYRFGGLSVSSLPNLDETPVQHPSMPIMSADLALQMYEQRLHQSSGLQSYTDETLVMAELPESSQRGAFELHRAYNAPNSLSYRPIRFTGDTFVKSSVISRVLQSEVDYVAKGNRSEEELSSTNYKFSYKGLQDLNGHSVHVFQVKPRQKRMGLFKGRVFLDAHNGALVRSEGSVSKSPSFFVHKIEFVQDYTSVDQYTVPSHLHSTAQARIIGKTVVDIYHRDYQLNGPVSSSVSTPVAVSTPVTGSTPVIGQQ